MMTNLNDKPPQYLQGRKLNQTLNSWHQTHQVWLTLKIVYGFIIHEHETCHLIYEIHMLSG